MLDANVPALHLGTSIHYCSIPCHIASDHKIQFTAKDIQQWASVCGAVFSPLPIMRMQLSSQSLCYGEGVMVMGFFSSG